MKRALVLIDIQNDYFKNGNCELYKTEEAACQAAKVLKQFRENNELVVFVQHISVRQNATFFLPNSYGCEIHHSIMPMEGEAIVIKHAPNSFFQTDLNEILKKNGIEQLVISGMMSHMCIDTTVRAAREFGYDIIVLEDACTTKDLKWKDEIINASTVHNTIMAALKGSFANVMTVGEFLE